MKYAMVEKSLVLNVILWNGDNDWTPPAGITMVSLADDSLVAPGWTYDGKQFISPAIASPGA